MHRFFNYLSCLCAFSVCLFFITYWCELLFVDQFSGHKLFLGHEIWVISPFFHNHNCGFEFLNEIVVMILLDQVEQLHLYSLCRKLRFYSSFFRMSQIKSPLLFFFFLYIINVLNLTVGNKFCYQPLIRLELLVFS